MGWKMKLLKSVFGLRFKRPRMSTTEDFFIGNATQDEVTARKRSLREEYLNRTKLDF